MSREKHKVTKRISTENAAEHNRNLALFGEFAEEPAFEQAFSWRLQLLIQKWLRNTKGGRLSAEAKRREFELTMRIGEIAGRALRDGDWRFFESLAKATKFLNERCNWKADGISDFAEILAQRRVEAVDPLRFHIANEWFCTSGIVVDKAKRSRKAFMEYIESKVPDGADGVCEKTFDRACRDLGISWKK